jgi:hypothetical protein
VAGTGVMQLAGRIEKLRPYLFAARCRVSLRDLSERVRLCQALCQSQARTRPSSSELRLSYVGRVAAAKQDGDPAGALCCARRLIHRQLIVIPWCPGEGHR